YLPFVLGANMAHYWQLGLSEAGRVLPVTAATFGWNGAMLPIAVAHPAVISFLQAITLIGTFWLSVFVTQKIARLPLVKMLPQHGALAVIGMGMWWTIVGW
ncbi:AAA family ATPase, partial [Leptolyngbya sp. FACHB-36]|nr:AAA family ATPase [Leptolyngbya sp. FACHB-36]